ncbi:MAG TPA: A/G-specific adenine glycosylase [Candidatus Acidoferrum sp.]|nr:A/G-specific adenine glycosylase [Candidatus Acidoferrum sp.]
MRKSGGYRLRFDEKKVRAFQNRLLQWFRVYGRRLPWRGTRDPYKILGSEVMLQQTQVDRVRGFYQKFLRAYPTVQDLAEAQPASVREAWEGLGYYARARNLHAAARAIVGRHAGRFPRRVEDVQGLPGVGRYTAGAVVSFAYGDPAPILDTNVRRVLSRIFVRRQASRPAQTERRLWALAEVVIPEGNAWAFNQALMDFGATLCTARNPQCPACPMRSLCAFFERRMKA